MAKISKEEYEILKGLDDQWKWVARDSDGNRVGDLFAYPEKPLKNRDIGSWVYGRWFHSIDNRFFQFIQWEDEEPYNVAELIEEYENSHKGSWEHAIEFSKKMREESEEKEVKNIEEPKSWFEDDKLYVGEYVKHKINQLDEPEVLSQEWIDEHAKAVAYDGMPDQTEVVYVDDLQNLLVPKQELPSVPQFVPEEQKYRVIFPSVDKNGKGFNYLAKDCYHKELWVEDARTDGLAWEERSSFTENEIRDLDKGDILFEHFAVSVEEMEE